MDIMREFSIPVPRGFMATSAAEASSLYTQNIGKDVPVVVKAMVLAGNIKSNIVKMTCYFDPLCCEASFIRLCKLNDGL